MMGSRFLIVLFAFFASLAYVVWHLLRITPGGWALKLAAAGLFLLWMALAFAGFGLTERLDLPLWAAWLSAHCGAETPLYLAGISMGAATVLMAAGLELPDNVRCVVADCPYSTPGDIIRSVCRRTGLPAGLLWPFVWLGARFFGGFDINAASAVEAVKKARVPILIFHGEDDRYVPCAMSAEIAAANPAIVERHTFPGAAHGLSFLVDPVRYKALLTDFLQNKAHIL